MVSMARILPVKLFSFIEPPTLFLSRKPESGFSRLRPVNYFLPKRMNTYHSEIETEISTMIEKKTL
jgi:hypothetical protein